eukprot:TRINITY_DN4113_c0_g1_i1.p1 TRINITY_DN4113_c0_g1~~TRINITY_DN4113_c0_g1_i1.p1  ORF type:complete len:396 (-),score=69.04 TRINITY_DN4113_c0_g1_i1:265-1452(-)
MTMEAAKSGMDGTLLMLQKLGGSAGLFALICFTLTATLVRLQALLAKRVSSKKEPEVYSNEGFGPDWEVPTNLDWAPARRSTRAAYQRARGQEYHVLFSDQIPEAKTEECLKKNSRGLTIFSKSWLPATGKPKGVACYCHGYGDTCTFYIEGIARYLASKQYAVFALDYPGFGLSSGLHGYISNFDQMVDDVVEHFASVRSRPELQGLPCFLFGQSMGGAVALKVHFKQPDAWNGAVLVAPMCKMADAVTPPWAMVQFLKGLAQLLPKAKLVPDKDLAFLAFKEEDKRKKCRENVIAYKDQPRLRTALELLKTTEEIERRLGQVSLPLLVLHGAADRVTDPSVSQSLVEQAKSQDKTLILYEDAWHSILEGEPDQAIFQVLNDIVNWLDIHTGKL